MGGFWKILELEPTLNIFAIRRAYAQKTRICHPEEDPEGFLELRKAYQAAMDYAECGSGFPSVSLRGQGESGEEPHEEEPAEEKPDNEESAEWSIPAEPLEADPNPFCDGKAIRQFMDLYTGKQRKNPKLWMDYFTSDAFLDAAWDGRFTAMLLEKVTEVEQDFPLNREFMMWLGIAYQFSMKEEPDFNREQLQAEKRQRRIKLCQSADFKGMEAIRSIAAKGPLPRRAGGDELAVLESFKDYRHLLRMAESGSWNEQAMEEFKWIMGRYTSAYIKESCDTKVMPDYQRHPAGLRILIHFFQRDDLPEELYRIVWRKYDLKNTVTGRMKIFYGALRKLVMERVPGIEREEPENFLQLNRDRTACFARIQANPGREEEELDAFFAQESIQKALRSRRFVEEQLLSCSNWLNNLTPECFVRWLKEFYRENQDIFGWDRVVEQAERELEYRIEEQKRKDEEADAVPEELNLSLLFRMPERVYVQPLTGPEREDWNAEPLTEEGLTALFDRFAGGELTRLQLEFGQTTLALVRDEDKYACFCFEADGDTWYSMLSQPEEYWKMDSKDVEYLPFGMGKLASYNIHESPASILRSLNLVFMQIGRERIRVRMGDRWLWSSHTSRQNSQFKKWMAMQELAKIPAGCVSKYMDVEGKK